MAVLFASCSNGMGEKAEGSAAGTSSQVVMVSLDVALDGEFVQKVLTVDDFELSGLTVWYKAVPQWSQTKNISGDTRGKGDANDFIQIPNFTSNSAIPLGSFTAGIWNFSVEVRKGSTVVYSGVSNDYSIYTGHATIAITATPVTASTGTVTISVQVPTTGDAETLSMTYTGPDSDTVALTRGSVTSNIRTFTTGDLDLTPGAYTFTFLYSDQNTTQNGGASVAVNVVGGQTADISGLIEDGKWHSGTITIKVPGFTNPITLFTGADREHPDAPAKVFVAPSTTLKYHCSDTAATSGNTLTYEWYVNGEAQSNNDDDFDFSRANYGMYEITCFVSDGTDVIVHASLYVEVTNTITVSTVNVTSNKAHATTGEIVTLKPVAHYAISAVSISPAETAYPVEGGYAFHMPSGAATVTPTAAATYVITLPDHALFTLPATVQTAESNEAPASVIVTLKPAKGYSFTAKPTVSGVDPENVNPDGQGGYTFTMPAQAVTVTGTPVAN